jgi:hypothetical protein
MNGEHLWLRLLYVAAAGVGRIIGGALSDNTRHVISPATAQTAANGSQIVSAKEFRLLDEGGKVRARLFLDDPYTPKLALYAWRGGNQEEVSLSATIIGGQLTLLYPPPPEQAPEQQQGQIHLRAEQDGGELTIGRKDSFPEIDLSTSKHSTGLNLASSKDQKRAIQASVEDGGQIFVLLRDHNEEQRAGLELDKQDNPGVYLYDRKGEARSSLALDEAGNPNFALLDTQRRIRADLELDADGSPSLTLNDPKHVRAVLGSSYLKNTTTGSAEHRSPSSLVLFREDGKLLWSAP